VILAHSKSIYLRHRNLLSESSFKFSSTCKLNWRCMISFLTTKLFRQLDLGPLCDFKFLRRSSKYLLEAPTHSYFFIYLERDDVPLLIIFFPSTVNYYNKSNAKKPTCSSYASWSVWSSSTITCIPSALLSNPHTSTSKVVCGCCRPSPPSKPNPC
jgi:hypothetical protein